MRASIISLFGFFSFCLSFASFAETTTLNLRIQYERCVRNSHNNQRDCKTLDNLTEPVEFEFNNSGYKKVKLMEQNARAFVTLTKVAGLYDIRIQLDDLEDLNGSVDQAPEQTFTTHISNIIDPSKIEEQIFTTQFYDYSWDAFEYSTRAVIIVGGNNTRPFLSPFKWEQNMMKAFFEGDAGISVSKVGLNENGFEVIVSTSKTLPEAFATLFSGFVCKDQRYCTMRLNRTIVGNNRVMQAQDYPKDIDQAVQIFNQALSDNKYFVRALNNNGTLVVYAKPMLIKAGREYFSAEQVFKYFFADFDTRAFFSNVPGITKIKIFTEE